MTSSTKSLGSLDKSLTDEELEELFAWLDGVPLSRKKKNLTRDFSDGILVAEIIKFYFPRFVELHNYSAVNSRSQKINNWTTLNRKVLPKLEACTTQEIINKMVDCTPGIIEVFLYKLWRKVEYRMMKSKSNKQNKPINKKSESFENQQSLTSQNSSMSSMDENFTMRNPIPLEHLDLSPLDIQTRLILEEKEQALLASQETVQILQVKIRRLEHLLKLKDLRISDFESQMSTTTSPRYSDVTMQQQPQRRHQHL